MQYPLHEPDGKISYWWISESHHGGDAIAQKFHVCNVQIQLPAPLRMVLLLCDFIRSRGEQIDLMQPFALANIHQRFLQVLQIVFGKVVLVSSLAVDWPFGVGLRLYINQRKTTMIGHSTGRRITMKPLFPEKFLMQPIICGHPAIIQRKTDPCPC